MKSMNKLQKGFSSLILIIVVAAVLVLGGIFFLYSKAPSKETIAMKQEEMEQDIVVVKKKVAAERSKLKDLQTAFGKERPLNSALQDAVFGMSDAVGKTDALFNFRTTSNPQIALRTQNADIALAINALRKQIAALLAALEKKRSASLSTAVSVASLAGLKTDAASIQAYLNNLKAITDGLTPANSGLSQAEIDADRALVASALNELNNVIASLNEEIPPPPAATVTEEDIEAQQQKVDDAEAELAALEEQAAALQASSTAQTATEPQSPGGTPAPEPPIDPQTGAPKLIEFSNKN